MEENALLEPFVRMLETIAAPAAVRAVEDGGPIEVMWRELQQSGFLDALIAGLTLAELCPLLCALGRFAMPVPVAETMVARKLLADAGRAVPEGPIAFVSGIAGPVFGRVAEHVLEDVPEPVGALLAAAAIAGGAGRLLDMTTAYANERVQFGKPIGAQQAIQQQLAVMAEDVVATRLAVELACAGGWPVRPAPAATAKSVASAAAVRIANTAHAVHGAIGISREHDLQIHSRWLHRWRLAAGSESYWNRRLGELRLAERRGSVDWIRAELFS